MDILTRILEVEQEKKLLDVEVCEFPLWGYIRFDFIQQVIRLVEERDNSTEVRSKKTSLGQEGNSKKLLKTFVKNAYVRSPFRLSKSELLLINHERRMREGSADVAVYFDVFIQELQKRNISFNLIEPINSEFEHYQDVSYNKNVAYFDQVELYATLYAKLNRKKSTQVEEKISYIVEVFEKEFDIRINREHWIEEASKLKSKRDYEVKYFIKMLRKLQPKRVVEVVHYSTLFMALNEACKVVGIPCVELQHGVMGKDHIAYNYLEKHKLRFFPDEIFLFSKYWKDVTRFPITEDKLQVVGFPYLEERVAKAECNKNRKNHFLFISQKPIAKELSGYACELDRYLTDKGIEHKIYYKLHPAECADWRKDLPQLAELVNEALVEVIDDSAKSVYDLFELCEVQIGVYSTAVLEGMAYGMQTYLLDIEENRYLRPVVEKGYAQLTQNPQDIFKDEQNNVKSMEEFWPQNSIANMLERLML